MTGLKGRPKKGVESEKLWSNKDYISNYNKTYYEKQKQDIGQIICDCKRVVSKKYLEKHKLSKYHEAVIKMMQNLAENENKNI